MADMEKVISSLECISNGAKQPCRDCEYSKREEWCIAECAKDALALLKEYAEMEKTYSQVLMETTGNLLSKTNYTLTAIMDCIREHYCDGCDVREELDTLLKAQEPKLVKYTTSTIRCPRCNKQITSRGSIHNEIKYCWKCGQAVKWE